jgi:hypothetical protein
MEADISLDRRTKRRVEREARGNHQISLLQGEDANPGEVTGWDGSPGNGHKAHGEPVKERADNVVMWEETVEKEREPEIRESMVSEESPPPVEEVCAPEKVSGHVTDVSSLQEGSAAASWIKQRQELGLNMTSEEERIRQKMAGKVTVFAKVKLFNEMNEHKFAYNGPVMKLACGYLRYNQIEVSRKDWTHIVAMVKRGMSEARNRLRNAIRVVVKGELFCSVHLGIGAKGV